MDKSSKFTELIRLQRASGLTVKEFCSNEGITPSTFYYWQKKLEGKGGKKDFIPLILKSGESSITKGYTKNSQQQGFQQELIKEESVLLELVYPNGTLLRIKNNLDLAHIKALIHLYD